MGQKGGNMPFNEFNRTAERWAAYNGLIQLSNKHPVLGPAVEMFGEGALRTEAERESAERAIQNAVFAGLSSSLIHAGLAGIPAGEL